MRAVICERYGPPEVLRLKDVIKPMPRDNELLVNIKATTVTQADIRVRGFRVPLSFWLPARLAIGITMPKISILGTELAGVVEEVGKEVTKFKAGDEVVAFPGHKLGCYAEYRCVPEDGTIVKKPSDLSFEEAAALPMGGMTALYFLRNGNIGKGRKVLIYGASGSVGTYAVQLAKHFGAEVTGVCSKTNMDLVRSLGADDVIDYTEPGFTLGKDVYDVVFDAVGKASLADSMRSLKKGGSYLQAVGTPGMMLRTRLAAATAGKNAVGGTSLGSAEDLAFIVGLAGSGTIRPVIDRRYPLEQIVEAHRYVELGHKKGNLVIKV